MKKYLIAGNWKMNTVVSSAEELVNSIKLVLKPLPESIKVLVCPPFTNLASVKQNMGESSLLLGAQNCHWESKGAYTGEISIDMLKVLGVKYIIIGHSERRTYFFETNEILNKKIHSIFDNFVKPIYCIGETLKERESGKTFDILYEQLEIGLKNVKSSVVENLVIAYEPVWAIGTGIAATVEQVEEAHDKIRNKLIDMFGENANDILLLYGGSVTPQNSLEIFGLKNVNGALVGGASLKAESFIDIINSSLQLTQH